MTKSPQDKFHELTKASGPITESDVAAVYDELPITTAESLIGSWKGGSFDTGHPTHKTLSEVKWAGKNFRSANDVDPMVIYDDEGKRQWAEKYGKARLREVKFRGKVSTAMVYDSLPIIDSFRTVDSSTMLGAMDVKGLPEGAGTYYFYLSKL